MSSLQVCKGSSGQAGSLRAEQPVTHHPPAWAHSLVALEAVAAFSLVYLFLVACSQRDSLHVSALLSSLWCGQSPILWSDLEGLGQCLFCFVYCGLFKHNCLFMRIVIVLQA